MDLRGAQELALALLRLLRGVAQVYIYIYIYKFYLRSTTCWRCCACCVVLHRAGGGIIYIYIYIYKVGEVFFTPEYFFFLRGGLRRC